MRSSLLAISVTLSISGLTHADELFQTGRTIFTEIASPSCTVCHTLKEADSSGEIGPDFNELQPTAEQVVNVVTSGSGIMPSFSEILTADQIKAVAHYVSTASRMD